MSEFDSFLKMIKQAAVDAVVASKPVALFQGVVINVDPIQIRVDQKMILEPAQLIFCEHVMKSNKMSAQMALEDAQSTFAEISEEGTQVPSSQMNSENTKDTFLKVGDSVLLFRMQGGQKYVVMDRMVSG